MSYSVVSEEVLKMHQHLPASLTEVVLLAAGFQLFSVNCCLPSMRLHFVFCHLPVVINDKFSR